MKALATLGLLGAVTALWVLFWAGFAYRMWKREDV